MDTCKSLLWIIALCNYAFCNLIELFPYDIVIVLTMRFVILENYLQCVCHCFNYAFYDFLPKYAILVVWNSSRWFYCFCPFVFFQLQFTRANIQPPAGQDPQSIIVPLLYDISANTIQHMEPVRGQPQTPAYMAVSQLLQNFYHPQSAECILFPAVQHIMANLNL